MGMIFGRNSLLNNLFTLFRIRRHQYGVCRMTFRYVETNAGGFSWRHTSTYENIFVRRTRLVCEHVWAFQWISFDRVYRMCDAYDIPCIEQYLPIRFYSRHPVTSFAFQISTDWLLICYIFVVILLYFL